MTGRSDRCRRRWGLGAALALAGAAAVGAPLAAEPLKVVGHQLVVEIAPLLAAADRLPLGSVVIGHGGIRSLWPSESAPGATADASPIADLAGNAETQALIHSVRHPDLRIIMTVTEGLYRIVARKSAGIRELKDLRGKRIGTIDRTSAEFYLDKMLRHAGMTIADVTVVQLPIERHGDVLLDGNVDVLAMPEFEPERVRQRLGDDAIEFNEFGVYRELYNLNVTTATLADPVKRRQVVDYVRALIPACRDSTYNPARSQALLARNSGHDPKLIKDSWHHLRFPCGLPLDLLDVLVEEEQWLAAKDKRPARPRAQLVQIIDPSILAEARRGH